MNYRTTLLIILAFIMAACQPTVVSKNAVIKFENTEYNFGKLQLNQSAEYSFVYSNPGDIPLLIQEVKTSCGCTVPQWPTKPVKPGKSEEIKINYDTSHPGMFQKTISVFYNGKNSPVTLLIKGKVEYPESASTTETIETTETKK